MAEIALAGGFVALVDDDDLERLTKHSWSVVKDARGNPRAKRSARDTQRRKITIYMHREILGAAKGVLVDHVNRHTLDNRKANLRLATKAQNNRNRTSSAPLGFKGVTRQNSRYHAAIRFGRRIFLGAFATPEEAARAYDEAALRLHGAFAATNVSLGLLPPLAGA